MDNTVWIEREFSNHVGFWVNFRTYDGDFFSGTLLGVSHGTVTLTGDNGDRMACDLDAIASYCIFTSRKNTMYKKKFGKKVKMKKKS